MNSDKKYIIFYINNSKFINVYGMNACILNFLLGYKTNNGMKVGFPNTVFNKVKEKLEEQKVSYQVIGIDSNP